MVYLAFWIEVQVAFLCFKNVGVPLWKKPWLAVCIDLLYLIFLQTLNNTDSVEMCKIANIILENLDKDYAGTTN